MRPLHYLIRLKPWLERPSAPIWAAIVGAALCLPALWGGFAADDHTLRMIMQGFPGMEELQLRSPSLAESGALPEDAPRLSRIDTFSFADGDPERNQYYLNRGLIPWWSTPSVRLAFWRPLASITHYIDHLVFGDLAWPAHLLNLLWYIAACVAIAALYKRMIPGAWIAALAATLYAIDDAHGLPVGWIANRNAIMAVLFGAGALIMHDKWRRDGQWLALPFGLVFFALGLLCGEATLAICGYLFAHAVFLDRGGWLRGGLSLIPYGLVIIPWRIVYQHLGYGATGSGMYLDPVREPLLFLGALIERLPVLLSAQLAYPPAAAAMWIPMRWQAVHVFVAIEIVLFLIWVFVPLLRHSAIARFWFLGMVIATLPVCATFPMDRLLFFAGIGGMGLVAMFLGGIADGAAWVPQRKGWRSRAVIVVTVFLAIHLVISPISMPFRAWTMALAQSFLDKAVDSLPNDPGLAQTDLVVVSTPSDFDAWHIPIIRSSMRQVVPRNTWALTVGPFLTECRRLDAHTLEIRPEFGFVTYPYARMFRGPSYPFAIGDKVELDGMTATVTRVNADHMPSVVEFRFDRPLEDPSLRFVTYVDGRYVPWRLPAVGGDVNLPGHFMFNLGTHEETGFEWDVGSVLDGAGESAADTPESADAPAPENPR